MAATGSALRWPLLKLLGAVLGLAATGLWAWQQRPSAWPGAWHVGLLVGVFLSCASLCAYSARFRCVMALVALDISRVESLRIVSFAVFCQFFVPLGAGAEMAKFFKLRGLAPERRMVANAAAIVVEHLLGLVALVMTAAVLFATLRPFAIKVSGLWLVSGAVVTVMAAAVVLFGRQRGTGLGPQQLLTRLWAHKSHALGAVWWSVIMHALLAAAVYVGSSAWALPLGYWQVLLVLSAAGVLQAVPANLVGVGAADVAGAGLYVALGLPLSGALLLVSLLYSYRALLAVLGGLWELDKARRAVLNNR